MNHIYELLGLYELEYLTLWILQYTSPLVKRRYRVQTKKMNVGICYFAFSSFIKIEAKMP